MSALLLNRRRLIASAAGVLCAATVRTAMADPLPTPKGKVILSISGKIGVTNVDGTAQFDREMLENLGITGITTATPWYDGQVKFEGVMLDHLMSVVGATGETAVATALNDYETKIPISDFHQFGVLLALKRNGEYMPVRDKGPLFIVYPFDSNPELKSQKYFSRSAWQLARLTVI